MPADGKQIEEIIKGCRKNNRQSQNLLFELYKDYATNICYRYAGQVTEIQDLVCDGFMKVYKNIEKYDDAAFSFNEASFKAWFKRVLINNCINYNKQFNKLTLSSTQQIEEESLSNTTIEKDIAIQSLGYKELYSSVLKLPASYKAVFCLFIIDGYSHEEIAKLLDISIGTSKSNLFKAKQWLQKLLNHQN